MNSGDPDQSRAKLDIEKMPGFQFTYDCGDEPEEEDDEVRNSDDDDDDEQDDILIVEGEDEETYDEASSPEFR